MTDARRIRPGRPYAYAAVQASGCGPGDLPKEEVDDVIDLR